MTTAPHETAEPTDAELVERCLAGDADAWALLVERFSRYVYAIAVRGFRLPEQDAEDVFQDTFLRVYERLGTLRDSGQLRPWIAQVTRRLCLDRLAAARAAPEHDELPELAEPDGLDEIEEALDVHEARRDRCLRGGLRVRMPGDGGNERVAVEPIEPGRRAGLCARRARHVAQQRDLPERVA